MKAAVVRSFDASPRYEDFDLPPLSGSDDVVVNVLATGLHPRVRSNASGSHYADEHVLPMIPGIDAVGRLADGKLVYCVVHDTPFGTMAEQVIVDRRRCVQLPDGIDPAVVAAAMNPAMSSWIALRLPLQVPGQINRKHAIRSEGYREPLEHLCWLPRYDDRSSALALSQSDPHHFV